MSGKLSISIMASNQDWLNPHLGTLDKTALHSLYIADHPSFDTTDSWSWLAYAAGQTEHIRLGTHVTGASFHHPTRLAKQVLTVEQLSNGRATLGIGTGYEVQDYMPYGFNMPDFKGRVRFLEETISLIKQCFSGRLAGFSGEFFTYEGEADFAPAPLQSPGIPIVIGLNKAGLAMQVAARYADAINTWQLNPEQVAAISGPLADAVEAAGRPVGSVGLTSDVLMVRDANREKAEAFAHQVRDMARSWGRSKSVTQWEVGGVLHGDAEAICEQALAFADVGVSELTVAVSGIDDALWLANHVVPKLH